MAPYCGPHLVISLISTFHSIDNMTKTSKMTNYIKELHAAIFTDPVDYRKNHLVLDLIEKEYNKHFDYIIIVLTFQ